MEVSGTYVAGQSLVIFHQVFILLIDSQHLADPVGCCLSLGQGKHTQSGLPEGRGPSLLTGIYHLKAGSSTAHTELPKEGRRGSAAPVRWCPQCLCPDSPRRHLHSLLLRPLPREPAPWLLLGLVPGGAERGWEAFPHWGKWIKSLSSGSQRAR